MFYALSLLMALLLLVFGVALIAAFALGARAIMLALVGAGSCVASFAVLRGLDPRRVSHRPPHVALRAADAPELFGMLRALAAEGGTKAPDAVLIQHGHDASVDDSSPIPAHGTRTLTLGVGLFSTLTVDELRAVIASRFGHFVAGHTEDDARLFTMRQAMIRIIDESLRTGGPDDVMFLLYRWLFRRFERDAAPVMREQATAADAYAAKIAGSEAYARALERIIERSAAMALLDERLRPLSAIAAPSNRYAVLRRFSESAEWSRARAHAIKRVLNAPPGEHDRSPALQVRIDAVRALAASETASDPRSASALIPRLEELETALCAMTHAPGAPVIDVRAFNTVIETQQQISAARAQSRVATLTVQALLEVVDDRSQWDEFVCAVEPGYAGDAEPDHREAIRGELVRYAEAYLSTLLGARGWRIVSPLGDPIVLQRADERIELGAALERWTARDERDEALIALIEANGVRPDERVPLSPAVLAQHQQRAAIVEVRPFATAFEVKLQLRHARMPSCCIECRETADRTVIRDERAGGALVAIALPSCAAHEKTVHAVLRLREYDPRQDVATFDTRSESLALLIARVNA